MRAAPSLCITGIAGFIGANLAREALQRGWKVWGMDNLSTGKVQHLSALEAHPHFEWHCCDISNFQWDTAPATDFIVHLASKKIPRYGGAEFTLNDNFEGIRTVAHQAIALNARLLFASSSDVYGKSTRIPFSENDDLVLGKPEVLRWTYALSKLYGEQYLFALKASSGLDMVIARLFGVYGPFQHHDWWGGPQSVFFSRAQQNQALELHGDGQQTRCLSYVDDVVQALMLLLENGRSGEVYNVAGFASDECSIEALGRKIWDLVHPGTEPPMQAIPYSEFGAYEDVQRRVPNLTKLHDLGFVPKVPLEEGLQRTWQWIQQNTSNFR